jgi:hypothetical protein
MSRPYIIGNSVWLSTIALSQLFEDLEVRNYTARYGDTYTRRIKVDVTLDMKERIQHKLLAGGHKALEQADTRLPRISINIANITPDIERYAAKNMPRTLRREIVGANGNKIAYDIQPFPINIEYTVSIWAKYYEHYVQLLENIIPWFDPYMIVGVKERDFNIEREIKVSLTSVGQNTTFEMEGPVARIIRGDLGFNVETVAYKTMNKDVGEIIEKVEVHVIDLTTPLSSETIQISASSDDILM